MFSRREERAVGIAVVALNRRDGRNGILPVMKPVIPDKNLRRDG
jgi:hypothetical protein